MALELCTIEDVLTYPGMETIPEKNQPWLARLIRGFASRAERYTDRLFVEQARTQQFSSERDATTLSLPAYGKSTNTISTVKEAADRDFTPSDILVDSDSYFFDWENGVLHRTDTNWINGKGVIQVVWTGGIGTRIDDVPDDLRSAAILQVAFWWQRHKDLGVSAKTFGQSGGSVSINAPLTLLPEVAQVLDTYRRQVI